MGGSVDWMCIEKADSVHVYAGRNPFTTSDAPTLYMTTTEIYATLDEAAALLDTTTPAKDRHFNSTLSRDILDSCILYDVALPTLDHPRNYIGVKWCALEVSTRFKSRDFCLLDCSDDFVWSGRRGWARVFHSIELDSCHDMQQCLNLVRGMSLWSRQRSQARCTWHSSTDNRGTVLDWANDLSVIRRIKALMDLNAQFQRHRLTRATFMDVHDVVASSACATVRFLHFDP
ncbi:hypothetical protein H310_01780 [Aphanomyces invadans]|uniref:Uncharacterized protein n=1 Tax=Aphanomyces invadans TaxID=157072 RepID=A0A024UL24_9STRA|nr:hypothetical protein H310_01780 [Aphanomyces invadans]ETW07151.1 hypothetical protein H310_01780 [Aphanomyces invadans]|eukprot:XP_008863244.1 hypothetical protein H310_01780 [Aphanomyces invadans]